MDAPTQAPPPPRAASPLRRWAGRAALVAAGLLAGLLVVEAIGRLDMFARGNDLVFMAPMGYPRDIYVQDGEMNYPNPKFNGTIRSFGYSIRPRFSSWGTRGDEPRPGVPTWIVVGDSFTIGLQVEEEETFSARLAQRLGVQALNAGVDGYSTWKEAIRAVQLGRHFRPDVVVFVFFTGNDFFDNRARPGRTVEQPGLGPGEPGAPEYAVPVAPNFRTAPWYVRLVRDNSVVAAHLSSWAQTRHVRLGREPNARRFREELALFTREGRGAAMSEPGQTEAAFRFCRDAVARLGARGIVAVVPPAFAMDEDTAIRTFRSVALEGVTPDLDTAQSLALRAVERAGLTPCDLMPTLRAAAAAGERPYLPFDGHLTPRGHAIVADAIATCAGG